MEPMPQMRPEDWPQRLAWFVAERRGKGFDWASNNCGLLAADWLAELVDNDLAADYRARCATALGAKRLLAEAGGVAGLAAAVCARHGWAEVTPAMARRGDLALVEAETPEGSAEALGVVLGATVMAPGATGAVFVPRRQLRRAWAIL